MSYVFRKIKKYVINLLEVFAFSSYYRCISIVLFNLILFMYGFVCVATFYINFIYLTWFIGLLYEIYKLSKMIRELEAISGFLSYKKPFALLINSYIKEQRDKLIKHLKDNEEIAILMFVIFYVVNFTPLINDQLQKIKI